MKSLWANVKRISSVRSILSFLTIWILLGITDVSNTLSFNEYLINNLGGIEINTMQSGFDMYGMIRWTVTISPPVIIGLLYINREMGIFSIYTVLRMKSMKQWWIDRVIALIVGHYLYFVIGGMILLLISLFRQSPSAQIDKATLLISLLFPFYTLTLCLLCVTAFIITGSQRISIAMYTIVAGISTTMGMTINSANPYMLGCYGMLLRSNKYDSFYGFSLGRAIFVMISFIVLCTFISYQKLKRNNPAASMIL